MVVMGRMTEGLVGDGLKGKEFSVTLHEKYSVKDS